MCATTKVAENVPALDPSQVTVTGCAAPPLAMLSVVGEGVNFAASVPVTVMPVILRVKAPVSLTLSVVDGFAPTDPAKRRVLPEAGVDPKPGVGQAE